MKQGYTHISMLIDRSGSMESVRTSATKAVNDFIKEQKELPDECTFTLGTFDTGPIEYQYDFVSLTDVKPDFQLYPRNATALYDSLNSIIDKTGDQLQKLPESIRPSQVLIVIQTDGQENASNMTYPTLAKKIKEQEDTYSWKFVFLGAGHEAMAEAKKLGIASATSFDHTAKGYTNTFSTLSGSTTAYRSTGSFSMPDDIKSDDHK